MFTQWTWDFLLDKNGTDESQDLSVNNNGIYNEQKHKIFLDMWALKQQYGKCLRHRDEDCLWLLHCTLVKTLPLPWRNVFLLDDPRNRPLPSGMSLRSRAVVDSMGSLSCTTSYHGLGGACAEMNMGMDAVFFLETAIFKAQSHQGRRYETRKTK